MTIKELINRLREQIDNGNGDARVLIMSQQGWPFEYEIGGLTIRNDFEPEKPDTETTESTDLFIVEGKQLRYGNKEAWNTSG